MPRGVYDRSKTRTGKASRGNRYSAEQKARVRKALETGGKTAKEIATEFGVSVFSVKDWKKQWRISKMRRGKKSAPKEAKPDAWDTLSALIIRYAEAVVADSWKGGGDPVEYPVIEKELELARLKLELHMEQMKDALS